MLKAFERLCLPMESPARKAGSIVGDERRPKSLVGWSSNMSKTEAVLAKNDK